MESPPKKWRLIHVRRGGEYSEKDSRSHLLPREHFSFEVLEGPSESPYWTIRDSLDRSSITINYLLKRIVTDEQTEDGNEYDYFILLDSDEKLDEIDTTVTHVSIYFPFNFIRSEYNYPEEYRRDITVDIMIPHNSVQYTQQIDLDQCVVLGPSSDHHFIRWVTSVTGFDIKTPPPPPEPTFRYESHSAYEYAMDAPIRAAKIERDKWKQEHAIAIGLYLDTEKCDITGETTTCVISDEGDSI